MPYASRTRTQSCLMSTLKWRRLMRIADGRMRIWGRSEESIFLRSRVRRPYCSSCQRFIVWCGDTIHFRVQTFAISSVFLNSPSMKVTFPSLSNSVHLSLSSFAAFPGCLRLRLVPPTSSRKQGRGGKFVDFRFFFSCHSCGFHSLFNNVRESVDAHRLFVPVSAEVWLDMLHAVS